MPDNDMRLPGTLASPVRLSGHLTNTTLQGMSAYEVAVANGFKGTEAEWLASLKGETGATPDISIGNITTGQPGTNAEVSVSGTPENPVMGFTIPRGDVGATPNMTIGAVATGEQGTQVQATITGTPENPVLNLTIPKGDTGDDGFNPVVEVTKDGNTATVSVTDATHTTEVNIVDGYTPQKNVDYFDGHSPQITGAKSQGTTFIYSDGEQIGAITDGQDGYTPRKGVDYFDGHTPAISGEKIDDTTFIYADGVRIATVLDGLDGNSPVITTVKSGKTTSILADSVVIGTISDGADGHSPTITTTKSGKTTTILSDGTSIGSVADGQDGHSPEITANKVGKVLTILSDGSAIGTVSDGADGVTPTITTNKSGTTTTIYSNGSPIGSIEDGPKGDDGDTPEITTSKTGKTTTIYADGSPIGTVDDGADGSSPVITATKSEGITTIKANGVDIATINDGISGDDGYSPTASVTKSGRVATITVTDKNGTTTAQVSDGQDGTPAIIDVTPTEDSPNAVSSGGVYDELTDLKGSLNQLRTATSEDVGKVLTAKTVTSGKVSEWEFSEIPDTVEIDDTAGTGDTNKVWSADKLTGKFDKVDNVLKAFGGNASFIWAWEEGSYGNMAEDPPTSKSNYGPGVVVKRIRSSFSMTADEKVTFTTQTGYKCLYSVYKDGARIEYESSTYKAVDKTYTGAGTYTFYVNLANTSDTAITIGEANSGLVVLTDNTVANINDAIAENAEKIESVDEKYADAFEEAFPGNPMFSLQWLLGGYANLANDPPVSYNTGNTRARVKVIINVKNKLTISCASGYKYVYSVYKGNVRQSYQASSWQTTPSAEFAYGAGTYTLYMNVSNSSNSAITTDEAKAAITILADNAVLDIYQAVAASGGLTETRNLFDPEASNTLRGYYNSSNTWQNVSGFGQTDFVAVKQGVKYDTPLKSVFVNWYNSSKEFISSTSGSTYNTQWYVIPVENAAYAKFIFRTTEHQDFYIHSDEPGSVSIPLDDIPYGLNNQFKGKNGVAFGTSLTYRAKSTGGYLEYLPVMLQMDFDNQGLGNSTILEHESHTDMMGTITGYTGYADKDVVIIEGFVNDWYDNSDKLGTWKDEGVITSTTVCGRIRYALNYILTQNPYATIIMILDPYGQAYNGNPGCASTVVKSGYTQMEYYEEIAKLAASMAIPTIKGYALSGMSEATPDYYIDIIHPSPLGAKQFANVIWENMKSIPIKVHN